MIVIGWLASRDATREEGEPQWVYTTYCTSCFRMLGSHGYYENMMEGVRYLTPERHSGDNGYAFRRSRREANNHRSEFHPKEKVQFISPRSAKLMTDRQVAERWLRKMKEAISEHRTPPS